MAGKGKKFKFHGAFKSKKDAMLKEAVTPKAFIKETIINGQKRYMVMTSK